MFELREPSPPRLQPEGGDPPKNVVLEVAARSHQLEGHSDQRPPLRIDDQPTTIFPVAMEVADWRDKGPSPPV